MSHVCVCVSRYRVRKFLLLRLWHALWCIYFCVWYCFCCGTVWLRPCGPSKPVADLSFQVIRCMCQLCICMSFFFECLISHLLSLLLLSFESQFFSPSVEYLLLHRLFRPHLPPTRLLLVCEFLTYGGYPNSSPSTGKCNWLKSAMSTNVS